MTPMTPFHRQKAQLVTEQDESIRISLVVVTYNRADEIMRLLTSLTPILRRTDVELVLVDDGSTDDTLDRVAPMLEYMGDRIAILRQTNQGPGVGRNAGIAQARGGIVVFVDTDCVVHPQWLEALTAPFEDPAVGATGGPDRSAPDDPLLARLIDFLMTSTLTTGGVRGAKKVRGGSYHPRSFNMAVRRDLAIDIGGFPVIWYGEDVLFSWRIAKTGSRLVFAPDAWVYHSRRTTVRGWLRQLYRMGRARWWLARHNRDLMEPVYAVPLAEVLIGASVIASLIAGGTPRIGAVSVLFIAVLYLATIGAAALKNVRSVFALAAVPALFLLRETAYALGSLAGIFTRVPDLRGQYVGTESEHGER